MATIVIGAQASGVGKTGLICSLIAAMPERRWTAIKITQCSHQSGDGKQCDCDLYGRSVAVTGHISSGRWPVTSYGAELNRVKRADSYRYLAAGAVRSLWVRTLPGHLLKAMPHVEREIKRTENVLIESNSVLEFLRPDVYAMIVSPCIADFKPSARRYLDRADAILMAAPPPGYSAPAPAWVDELKEQLDRAPQFAIVQPQLASPELVAFVRRHLDAAT